MSCNFLVSIMLRGILYLVSWNRARSMKDLLVFRIPNAVVEFCSA